MRYLHSDIDTIERVEILRGLRAADFDILVGINLLREGLDLPEVSLVCILDADKEGFLRSQTSLIQTAGRAARHINGEVVLFADTVTQSMQALISISDYRRTKQMEYNEKHGITPQTVRRAVQESLHTILRGREIAASVIQEAGGDFNLTELLRELEEEMQSASANLEFERAALLRDQIMEVKSGTGLTKIEPKRKPVKYTAQLAGAGARGFSDAALRRNCAKLIRVRGDDRRRSELARTRLALPGLTCCRFFLLACFSSLSAHHAWRRTSGPECLARSRIFTAQPARSQPARGESARHSSGAMETRRDRAFHLSFR